MTLQKGFSEYILGHAAWVNNNWGHNKEALQKSLQKRRDEGLWSKDPWNRGKTKENDPKFDVIAERAYGSKEFRQKRSEIMAHQWSNGILTIASGYALPMWHGGCRHCNRSFVLIFTENGRIPSLRHLGLSATNVGQPKSWKCTMLVRGFCQYSAPSYFRIR